MKTVLYSCLGLIVAIFAFAYFMNSSKKDKILKEGYVVKATIIEKNKSTTKVSKSARSTNNQLVLKYRTNLDQEKTGVASEFVSDASYERLQVGDDVNIYLMKNDLESPYLEESLKE